MTRMRGLRALLEREIVDHEGPTRPIALLRIGLAVVAWACYARELAFYSRPLHLPDLALSIVFFAVTTAMLVGCWSRAATALSGLTMLAMYYLSALDLSRAPNEWSSHHCFLLACATLLLSLGPCGDSLSVDRWLAERRGERGRGWGPLWAVRLIALQVSALYFWTATHKTSLSWLSGERLAGALRANLLGSDPLPFGGFDTLCMVTAWGVMFVEYGLAFGLPFQRTRRVMLPIGLILHAGIYLTLPVTTFSVEMFILYLAFLDPRAVDRALEQAGFGRAAS